VIFDPELWPARSAMSSKARVRGSDALRQPDLAGKGPRCPSNCETRDGCRGCRRRRRRRVDRRQPEPLAHLTAASSGFSDPVRCVKRSRRGLRLEAKREGVLADAVPASTDPIGANDATGAAVTSIALRYRKRCSTVRIDMAPCALVVNVVDAGRCGSGSDIVGAKLVAKKLRHKARSRRVLHIDSDASLAQAVARLTTLPVLTWKAS